MVNTFGILSAIVLAFSAFVAFKNKEEFEKQDIATKAEQGRLETNTKTYNGLLASIKQLEADTAISNESRDGFREKVETQIEKNATVQAEIDDKEKELAATKKEVADAEEKLKELGDIEDLAPKLERLQ
ncbi:hypothetical protein OAE39_01620, partial [Akkermansiaceae bacterium]|nr:hypothetical protein [Akkermansiaceae bacterium]